MKSAQRAEKIACFVLWRVLIKSLHCLETGDSGRHSLLNTEEPARTPIVQGVSAFLLQFFSEFITTVRSLSRQYIGILD